MPESTLNAVVGGSPAPPSPALADALRALGPVRWLVVPNCFHHLGTPAAAAHFPEAQVVGPASALARNEELEIQLDIQSPELIEQMPELEAFPLRGVPFLDETVLTIAPRKPCSALTLSFARTRRTIGASVLPRACSASTIRCACRTTSRRRFRTRQRPLARSGPCWSGRRSASSSDTPMHSAKTAATVWQPPGDSRAWRSDLGERHRPFAEMDLGNHRRAGRRPRHATPVIEKFGPISSRAGTWSP